MDAISIHGVEVPILEYEGKRVVTLAMVDKVHGRPDGTARLRFNVNRERFMEGEDCFVCKTHEAKQMGFIAPNGLVLLTESGYLLLVKSFHDDLAWQVQRELVNGYFRLKEVTAEIRTALSDPAQLRGLLLVYTEKVIELQAKVEEQAPKAAFHDAVVEAVNCQTIQEVAKVLGTGQNRLFKFLRGRSILMANNMPYQKYIDAGYFRVIEQQYKDGRKENFNYTRTLVTGKGLPYIQKLLSEGDRQMCLLPATA